MLASHSMHPRNICSIVCSLIDDVLARQISKAYIFRTIIFFCVGTLFWLRAERTNSHIYTKYMPHTRTHGTRARICFIDDGKMGMAHGGCATATLSKQTRFQFINHSTNSSEFFFSSCGQMNDPFRCVCECVSGRLAEICVCAIANEKIKAWTKIKKKKNNKREEKWVNGALQKLLN